MARGASVADVDVDAVRVRLATLGVPL